jgi:hypothetical protein
MHVILLEVTKGTFVVAIFILVNVNEVTTINNVQWLSIHLHGWKMEKILILLCVKIVGFSTTLDNIFSLMFKHMLEFGGLRLEELFLKS